MQESAIGTIKAELVDRHDFVSRAQARLRLFDYIENFYNPIRAHSSLVMLSPITSDGLTLRSRNRRGLVEAFPQLFAPPAHLTARSVILDGEIVAFNADATRTARLASTDSGCAGTVVPPSLAARAS